METQHFQALADTLRGDLIRPEDPGYDDARRVWNGMVDGRPAAIARCSGVGDVITAVSFARDNGVRVSVRGGGHGVAGAAVRDGTLVIDLSALRNVTVDPGQRIAHVSAGARLGDLDHESQAFALATTVGIDPRTGVAGLTLGGGLGILARRFGMTVDNLRAVDVVTPGGEFLRATRDHHPDLLWAAQGGRGVGVVTRFELELHPLGPEVQVAQAFHPVADAARVLAFYRELLAGAPDEFGCYAIFMKVPPDPTFPAESHGQVAVALVACDSSADGRARDCIGAVESFGEPILAFAGAMPYTVLQRSFEAGTPNGVRYYWKSHYLRELGDGAIAALAESARTLPGAYSLVGLESMGGAVARVDPEATAFAHRDARFTLGIWSGWDDPADDEAGIAWTRQLHQAMTPFATGGVYSNYLDHDDQEREADAFGLNYSRLAAIRRRYDPDGLIG